jgi:trk system potassium uptake protein TrkA
VYILIINEDPLGRALVKALVERGHEVAYVDEDPEYCQMVATEMGCLVIQGETTNIRVLQEAGIERAQVVVVLLEKDIKNIMVGLFARQFAVPQILARLRQTHYQSAYELAGITNIFTGFDYLLNQLLIAIEDPNVRQVMTLGDGRNEIAAIDVPADSPFVGQPVSALWEHRLYPPGALLLGVLKVTDQSFQLPRNMPVLEHDDELLALAPHEDIHRIVGLVNGQRRVLRK